MFFQILLNSNINSSSSKNPLIGIANALRGLIANIKKDNSRFPFAINFESFKYQRLQNALEKIIQVSELNIPDTFSTMWKEVSLSFIELENDEKQTDADNSQLYGNRLTTEELMHIPWRSNILAEHEAIELLTFIQQALINEESRKPAIIAMIVALTSKPFSNISTLKLFSKKPKTPSGDYIDLSSGVWVRESVKMPASFCQKEKQVVYLSKYTKWLYLISAHVPHRCNSTRAYFIKYY